jgi:invasion protein IalB
MADICKLFLRLAGVLCLVALTLPAAAPAQEVSKGRIGAWELRCQSASATPDQCGLTQTVRSEEKPNVNLAVIIIRPAGAKTPIMRIIVPLAVYLVNGVNVKIDQTDIGKLALYRCTPAGCITDAPLDDKLLDQMRNGKIMTLVIYLEPEEGLRHLVRLDGLKDGVEKLR